MHSWARQPWTRLFFERATKSVSRGYAPLIRVNRVPKVDWIFSDSQGVFGQPQVCPRRSYKL